jgi:hypothetical protein
VSCSLSPGYRYKEQLTPVAYDSAVLIDGAQLDAPAAPLDDLLRTGLEADPDAVALVSSVRRLSWREL